MVLDHSTVYEWADVKVGAGAGQTEVDFHSAGTNGYQLTITSPDPEPADFRDARLPA